MSDSKLMPVVYYNPAHVTRLTAYADTVVMERVGNEAFLRGIRFGGYPESVQAISDAIYAGARIDVTINGKQYSLKSESKRYDRQVNRDGVYTDVPDGAWYAEAVETLRVQDIMNGVGNGRFDPDGTFTRAALATVLYRMAGSPAVTSEDAFSDTETGKWYSDAVLWALQNQVVNGMGGGRFGTNEPTTQEQFITMLWRDAGSYVLDREKYASADGVENQADSWAFDAVVWGKAEAPNYSLCC